MKAHFRFLCLSLAMLCISAVSRAQLSGSITVPSTTYPDLASVITALNTSGVGTGGASITLTSANPQTAPSGGYRLGSAVLNASLSQTNPLTFNGNGNVLTGPTGVGTNDGVWWLMGTDWVTINSFSLLDVSTTTATTSTPGNEWGFVLGKRNTTAPYDGCQHVTISNCTISLNKYQGSTTTPTAITSFAYFGANAGILMAHVVPTSTSVPSTSSYTAADANSYNKFTGNTISNVSRGIYMGYPVSLAVNLRDIKNEVGGTTSASGNTITLGGTSLTSVRYGVIALSDSSAAIQNNKFYISASQTGNAAVYMVYVGGNSVGNMNINNNNFDITTNNTTALVAAIYNTASSGATYGYNDAGGTISMNGNEITGTGAAVTSASLYWIYHYYSKALTHNMNNNYIHDISWGVAGNSSSPYIYGLYTYYNIGTVNDVMNCNGNNVYNITHIGGGYDYLTYFYQYSAIGKVVNIQNNTFRKITRLGNSTSNYIYGMYNYMYPSSSTGSDTRLMVQNNVIDSIDASGVTPTNASCYIYNYTNYYAGDSSQITDNKFTNWKGTIGTGTNQWYTMYNYCYYGPNGTRVSRNKVSNMVGTNAYFFNYMGYYAQYCDSNEISNQVSNLNGTATGYTYVMLGYYGGYYSNIWPFGYCRGNLVKDIHQHSQNSPVYMYVGYYGKNMTLTGNTFRNLSSQHATYGILQYFGYYAMGLNAQYNVFDSIAVASSTSYPNYVYMYANGVTDTMANNKLSRFITTNNATPEYGLYLNCSSPSAGWHCWNNEITNFEVPPTYTGHMAGIYTNGVGNYKLFNNTIRLDPSTTPTTGYHATGIYYSGTNGTLDLRNNIMNVNVFPAGSGTTAALRRSSGSAGTAPANFLGSSNSNIYYAPNTTSSWLYAEGLTTGAVNTYNLTNYPGFNNGACGLYKSFVGHDLASFTENNLVLSGTVANAYLPIGPSYAEKGAAPTAAPTVVTDLIGATRSTPADIGALEFSGTVTDNAPPQIGYTALPAITYCLTAPQIVATITDQTAVDTSAGDKPKLYYKKSTENNAFGGANNSTFNGWKWKEPTSIVGNVYTFDMDYSKLFSAIAGGNTIQYFIMAQDTKTPANAGGVIASFGGSCPSSVNLVAANGPLNSSPAPNQFTVNSASLFTVTADLANICVSGSTIVRLSPIAYGTTLQWESATMTGSFSPIAGATGQDYTTPVLTSSTRYRVVVYCGTSVLTTTTPVVVNVNNPSLVSTTPATRCGYGQVTLSATPANSTTTVNWYTSATATNPIATGNAYTTPNLGSSVTYYASAVVPGGSTEKIDLPTIVTPYPSYWSSPAGYGMVFHFSDTTNFYSTDIYPNGSGNLYVELQDVATSTVMYSAGPFAVTGTTGNYHNTKYTVPLNFMNIPPGDYKLVVGSATPATLYLWMHYYSGYNPTFTYPTAYSSITGRSWAVGAYYPGQPIPYPYYWFFFFNNVISGPCENPVRYPVTATITPAVPITASSPNSPGICTGSSATVTVSSTNGTYLYSWQPGSLSGATQSVSPTTTTTYVVNAVDALTGCTAIDSVKINVNPQQPPPVVTPTNQIICQGSAVQLTATPATSPGGTSTVGTGTLANTTTSYPAAGMGQYYTADHEQYLITAAELTAAGVAPGPIFSLAFDHSASYTGAPMQDYTIKIAHTTQTSASLTLLCAGFTTVYGPSTYAPVGTGFLTLPFSTPFIWNGTSNIMVDVSHSNAGASCAVNYTSNATVKQSSTSYTSAAWYYDDGNCTIQSCTPSGAITGTAAQRPNMRFSWGKPYFINWVPNVTGLYKTYPPAAGPMTTADTNSKVWASPATTQIYTAVVNAQGCLSLPSNPDTVFVNPAPNTTISPAGAQAICAGGSVTLCVPTSSTYLYQWFLNAAAISGATSSCYTATAAGTYTCRVTDLGTGCIATTVVGTVVTVNPLPTASIAAGGPTTFCNGNSVVLGPVVTNASPGAIQWYNGSGPISGATGPSYTATASGTYYVTVMNGNQCSQTSNSITVTVNIIPSTVTPGGSTTFCTGGSVQLCGPTSGTGSPFTYQWYNGAASIPGATTNCYTATTSGNYYVVVSSASTGCNGTSAPTTVTVGAAPSSAITPSGAQFLCSNGSVTLTTNTSPGVTIQWNKNGTPISAAAEPTAITSSLSVGNNAATGPGSYTVTVSITGTPACNSTTSTPVVVTASTAPTSTFNTGGGPTTFCAGNSVTLGYTGTGASSWQWNLNGTPIPGATSSTYTATQGGSYTLKAINSAGCSTTSGATVVTVNPLPPVAVTQSGPSNICAGSSVTLTASPTYPGYLWKVNGSPAPGINTGVSYGASATGNYTVTVTDANGCTNTSTPVAVLVNPLPVVTTTPSGTQNVCSGSSVTICTPTNTSYTYQWKNPAVITGATQSCYTTGTAGSYTVTVTNTVTGCANTSTPFVLTVSPPPPATATRVGPATICAGDSSRINANPGSGLSYQWNYNGTPIASATNATYYAKQQGTYTVTVSNGNCPATSTGVSINVNPAPPAFITYNTPVSFCEGSAVALTANIGSGLTYMWYINDTITGNSSTTFVANTTGTYMLKTTNGLSCSTFSDTLHITVNPAPHPTIVRTGTTMTTSTTYTSYQWFLNNTAIGGATNQTYVATVNGAYKVRVIDAFGCEGYSELEFVQNVGVTPTPTSAAIKVYPNPTTGILKIDAPVKVQLILRDVTGKAVVEERAVKQIDITDVASGMYLLYISDMDGKLLRVDKVTKTAN